MEVIVVLRFVLFALRLRSTRTCESLQPDGSKRKEHKFSRPFDGDVSRVHNCGTDGKIH